MFIMGVSLQDMFVSRAWLGRDQRLVTFIEIVFIPARLGELNRRNP